MHGLPFRGPGETSADWWGGYCWHDTVLFPTWHRIYILYFENALRSISGCQDVTLPFWDEVLVSADGPIPSVLTSLTFELDGRTDNPLYSYKLQQGLSDNVEKDRYTKPQGYETVRYPLSGEYRVVEELQSRTVDLHCLLGLVGTEQDIQQTQAHNAEFPDQAQNTNTLNNNVTEWLLGTVKIPDDPKKTRTPDTYSIRAGRILQQVTMSFHWKVRIMRSILLLGDSTSRVTTMPTPFAAPMAIWAITRQLALIRYFTSIIASSTILFQCGSGSGVVRNVDP